MEPRPEAEPLLSFIRQNYESERSKSARSLSEISTPRPRGLPRENLRKPRSSSRRRDLMTRRLGLR